MNQSNPNYRFLIAEDVPTDAELVKREIRKIFPDSDFQVVDTREEYSNALISFKPDLIISDYQMPTFDGLSALEIMLEKSPETPLIIVTGSVNEETAVSCLKAGAIDYVLKESLKRLGQAVINALDQKEIKQKKRMAEAALIESEERFRRLAENAQDLIYRIELSPVTRLSYISPAVFHFTGYTQDEHYQNLDLSKQLVHPYDQSMVEKSPQTAGEIRKPKVFSWLKKDGTIVWTEQRNIPIYDEKGTLIAIEGIARDITERKKMIEELVVSKEKAEESDRLKSAFLANMSHEIRTPMNGILGFTELLKDNNLSGDEKDKFINIIQKSGQRLLNTVNDLIDISKIETGQMQVNLSQTSVKEQLLNLFNFFQPEAAEKKLKLILNDNTSKTEAELVTDVMKLDSILTNLIKNAIKYTDSGKVEIGCIKAGDQMVFAISDTGIGIPEYRQKAIFNRFEQADTGDKHAYQGSGLGLTIAKAYVEMLGGQIEVASKPGYGSVFRFQIPAIPINNSKIAQENEVPRKETAHQINNKIKILIAEDDLVGLQYLKTVLLSSASAIFTAENGKEAVEIFTQHPDIDLILMDIRMPVMDGYQATQKIREISSEVYIIAQTAFALSGDKEKSIDAGCNDYISKPIKKNELLQMVSNLIAKL